MKRAPCGKVTEFWAFLGVPACYRISVPEFSLVAAPLFDLQRKNVQFVWGPEYDQAVETIKRGLTAAPAVTTPLFCPQDGSLVLALDSGDEGWAAVLIQQNEDGRRNLCRYESRLWSWAEELYGGEAVRHTEKGVQGATYGVEEHEVPAVCGPFCGRV